MRYMIIASQFQVYHKAELELVKKVYQISKMYDGIVYKDDAGVRELQIGSRINKKSVLTSYYDRSN